MEDGVISLHSGLREKENADLEVVAEATLYWVEALKAAAREITPDAEIKIELVDAVEGSLKLNVVLE